MTRSLKCRSTETTHRWGKGRFARFVRVRPQLEHLIDLILLALGRVLTQKYERHSC